MAEYSIRKEVKDFDSAITRVKEKLKEEGFGVLTEIDVKATMKEKLDIDFDKYVILGACSPSSAHEALIAEKEMGLLLPCNIIIYEDKGKTFVSAVDPVEGMSITGNEKLRSIAQKVKIQLDRVIGGLS